MLIERWLLSLYNIMHPLASHEFVMLLEAPQIVRVDETAFGPSTTELVLDLASFSARRQ